MTTSTVAYLETMHGRKYLVQLCKHFKHKIEVDYDDTHGECRFASGVGILTADDAGLKMQVFGAEVSQRLQTQEIIESHLLRFAFREKPAGLDWMSVDEAA